MRNYVMSFGMNEPLFYFKARADVEAYICASNRNAEYCIRLRGWQGPTMYTVKEYVE